MFRIYDSDSWKETAKKIYNDMPVGVSCSVQGMIEEVSDEGKLLSVKSKAELVIAELRRLDRLENLRSMGKKMTRKRVVLPDSIGGYVAHKIFRFSHKIVDSDVRYTIWRVQ